MRGSAARGVLSGAVAGAGAWVAHTVSGGAVTPLAGLVALALSLALGPLLLAPRTSHRSHERAAVPADPLRVVALMLLTQGVWHLVFMVGAASAAAAPATTPAVTSAASAGPEHTALMLAAHVLAAVAATAVAVGLDRALLQAAVRVAAVLLPRPVVDVTSLPVPNRPAPVRLAAPPPLTSARLLLTRVLRGPPTGALPVRG